MNINFCADCVTFCQVTDLLTDVFAASEDRLGLYTRYMRIQIRQYLENHLKVEPFDVSKCLSEWLVWTNSDSIGI